MAKFALSKIAGLTLLLVWLALASTAVAKPKKKSTRSSTSSRPPASSTEVPFGAPLPVGMRQIVPEIPAELTELPIAARGAIVIDAATGEVLYEKNGSQAQYPASTTKIMTALLVIEAGDLDRVVDVTPETLKVGESSLDIKPGDHFTRREALFGLMLKSANDVAFALGVDNAGSMDAFAEKMTQRARELGATNTRFTNPHGLHHLQHYTSPRDLALISRAAMQQPMFRRIVSTGDFAWNRTNAPPRELRNHNRLLFAFPGCTGVKTGYTYPSQQVLVSAAVWDTREVIAVVMHTHKPGIWDDSRLLLTWGLLNRRQNSPPQAGLTPGVRWPAPDPFVENPRRPPTAKEIAELEKAIGHKLPPRFRAFMMAHNGGVPRRWSYEGQNGASAYFQSLYPIASIPNSIAEETAVSNLPPGYIVIGLLGDGGELCLRVADDRIFIRNYDDVDERGNIPLEALKEAAPDLQTFFTLLKPTEDEGKPPEPFDPIFTLANWADVKLVEEFIRAGGSLANARTVDGETLIPAAILKEDYLFLEACHRYGAPLTGALHEAARWNIPDAVTWLLKRGADVNELDHEGQTPVDVATPDTGASAELLEHGGRPTAKR